MVGTLYNMIASPSKPLPGSKSPIRTNSSIQPTMDNATYNAANSGSFSDDRRSLRAGIENQDTLTVYDDEEIDNDSNDANSMAFQCACKVWSCTQCSKAFNSARALKIHEVKQHENMPKRYTKCTHCDEVFDHGNLLQIHMKVHHNIKVQCPQCKDLPKPGNSKAPADPVCPVCAVQFDHDKLLKLHMEHYHKVSRKETLTNDQPLSNLLSPKAQSPDARTLSPDARKRTPSPRNTEGRFPRRTFFANSEEASRSNSVSPRSDSRDNERNDMYVNDRRFGNSLGPPRLLVGALPHSSYYVPFNDGTLPHYGVVGYYPSQGVRRSIEKRPLGRSQSLPLKQETMYSDVPIMPWQIPDTGHPMPYGVTRDKKINRAALEAMRNSLEAKLRSVEATLRRDEAESHQPLSPTPQELYENQRYLGREEELTHSYRPSVITPRSKYGGFDLKRQAPPNDLEPNEKLRVVEKGGDPLSSPSRSPRSPGQILPSISPRAREAPVPGIYEPREIPKVSRDDLAIPNLQRESFDDQAKIFIKRGAPRCNRCQQTFCSKMEYLHHLISHKENDGFIDASPEEMEFIEDVKRSMENKNLMVGDHLDVRHGRSSSNSSKSPSPMSKNTLIFSERSADSNTESPSDDKSPVASPSVTSSTTLGTETCGECKDVFADSASYQSHIEKRHMKPRCRECGLIFDHKNLLKIHMDCYHSSLEVLQCYYCGMSFKQRSAFLDHVTSHESQDIGNKERASEQSSESGETGGRRRWGRLVASAQLPSEKPDLRDRESALNDHLGVQDALALKTHTKQKLRKTVSLSAYTDMINRQKRTHVPFLHESRAKGDEAIGKEMRTRIFLPNFEDKMENLSRFASSSVQLAKKRVSPPPPPRASPPQSGGELRFRRHIPTSGQEAETSHYGVDPRPSYDQTSRDLSDAKPLPFLPKKKLVRMKRSYPLDKSSEMRAAHLAFPMRKAFVRDEVESLYQMKHKKAFTCTDVTRTMSDPLDHRSALVKIERVEVDPLIPLCESKSRSEHSSPRRDQTSSDLTVMKPHSPLKQIGQPISNAVVPPPLIDVRRSQASSTSTTVSDMDSTSSRSESPSMTTERGYDYKIMSDVGPSSPPLGELYDKNGKEKRKNSIKKMTKEALINSLSLKRRASAPDLYQFHRDHSTESNPEDKSKKVKYDGSPGSPNLGSEQVDSPSADTKHHGSRSIYYTPRKQSERDVTCTQCGVSFGHKKLYKIHLDSYHGKRQCHQCLQCGAKDFSSKDEFVKHLMAHQNEGNGDDVTNQDSPRTDQEAEYHQIVNDVDSEPVMIESSPRIRILKASSAEGSDGAPSDDEQFHYSPPPSGSEEAKSNEDSKVNNNGQETIDKKTCLWCCKTFENGKQLEQHFSSHALINDNGRFCCVVCNKAFETPRKLEVHSRSHTGFKPHKCEHCGRCFPYYSSYYYHKMTHTKDRPHKCPICGKGFIQTRYLRSHLTTHRNEQGSLSDEVESILRKAELNMNDETDEESIDSPVTAEVSPYTANDEETATAEILCSFKRGLNCSSHNADSESASLT